MLLVWKDLKIAKYYKFGVGLKGIRIGQHRPDYVILTEQNRSDLDYENDKIDDYINKDVNYCTKSPGNIIYQEKS